jgi:hypothetical protein
MVSIVIVVLYSIGGRMIAGLEKERWVKYWKKRPRN